MNTKHEELMELGTVSTDTLAVGGPRQDNGILGKFGPEPVV